MNPILRNILAVFAGMIIGSVVNMGILMVGAEIFPLPEGVDVSDPEALKLAMPNFGPEQFISPFLAHALGTLVGAFVAALMAARHKMKLAIGIGIFFLLGGIVNAFMLPAPGWFVALDLGLAYIPMGWLGGKLGTARNTGA